MSKQQGVFDFGNDSDDDQRQNMQQKITKTA